MRIRNIMSSSFTKLRNGYIEKQSVCIDGDSGEAIRDLLEKTR